MSNDKLRNDAVNAATESNQEQLEALDALLSEHNIGQILAKTESRKSAKKISKSEIKKKRITSTASLINDETNKKGTTTPITKSDPELVKTKTEIRKATKKMSKDATEISGIDHKTKETSHESGSLSEEKSVGKMSTQSDNRKSYYSQASTIAQNSGSDSDSVKSINPIIQALNELDSDTNSTSSSSFSETDYEVKKMASIKEFDFFANFQDMPSLSDISLDETVVVEDEIAPLVVDEKEDQGTFVDPLTGASLSSSQISISDEIIEAQKEESEISLPSDTHLYLTPKFDDDLDLDDDEILYKNLLEAEEKDKVKKDVTEEFDIENARLMAQKELQNDTMDFINHLLSDVVEKAEFVDALTLLNESLDKNLLIKVIKEKLSHLNKEQTVRIFLNRKVAEFCRRKKLYRLIDEENPKTFLKDKQNYKNLLRTMDIQLGRELNTKKNSQKTITSLKKKLEKSAERAEEVIKNFEQLVKNTMCRDAFPNLNAIVKREITKMANLRAEISEVRQQLIQMQHTNATLVEKIEHLENLGDGLRMHTFEALQTETQILDKKVEERNTELKELHRRYNSDLHFISHVKEQEQMLKGTINLQTSVLNDLFADKLRYREKIYFLKIQRDKLRKEIKQISFQGGLLDKPVLMYDYDETVNKCEKMRALIDDLKRQYADVQRKIILMEKKFQESSVIS